MGRGKVSCPVVDVASTQTLGKEQFEWMVNQLIGRIAEEHASSWIGQDNDAALVYHHDGVW